MGIYHETRQVQLAMPDDIIPFLIGIACLISYLVFSAFTEMGTRLPWKKKK